MMESIEQIGERLKAAIPGVLVEVIPNGSPARQPSLLLGREHAVAAARFLRDDPQLQLTGVDWLDRVEHKTVLVKQLEDGVEQEFEQKIEQAIPGYLEVVYHLYSMALKQGPLVIRMRTANRTDQTHVPSLTPVYRSAEFQEREVYDLFGIVFDGHPDLRRLLMWDEFTDHPMRKDYVEPDDYEYEPTPHGEVFEKAKRRYSKEDRHD
jgi:NADH-quinone oxidoreductase subunit C